jgi:hypothetical protein
MPESCGTSLTACLNSPMGWCAQKETGFEMNDQTPNYRVGDVVNGYRWNGVTWEPVPPGWGSGMPQYQVGQLVNGYRWNGVTWEPVASSWGPGVPAHQVGEVVNGHRWNGFAWDPIATGWAAAPASKKPWYQSPLGIGLMVLGALMLVGLVFGSGEESPTATAQPERASIETVAPTEQAVVIEESEEPKPAKEASAAGIGTPVRDGKFEFTVTDVQTGVKNVGNQYLNQDAQGLFTLVTVRVRNIGDESQMFDGSNVAGADSQGREVSSDSAAGIYANEDTEAFLNDINPGNEVTAVVVFDLPKGEKLVSVDVHDSMFSGGAQISLS